MTASRQWICALITGLLLWLSVGAAVAVTVAQRGNQIVIDGTPTALTFARGCDTPQDLPAYRTLGFNTLLVRVDASGTLALDHYDELINAAEQQGLFVLVELANGGWSMDLTFSARDKEYTDEAAYFLEKIIPRLKTHQNLVGWIISTVEEGQLICDSGRTFSEFIKAKYGTLEKLNAAWTITTPNKQTFRSKVPTLDLLNEKNVRAWSSSHPAVQKLVKTDIETFHASVQVSDNDFRAYLHTRYDTLDHLNLAWGSAFTKWEEINAGVITRPEKKQNPLAPMAAMELAQYQASVPRALIDWWARQIKTQDKQHLTFAGNQTSYRTLINLPPSINGAYTECYPGVAEPDIESHNPHAYDIARRGNRFIALAGILAKNTDPARFVQYLYEAPMHGAAGIGVADWPSLAAEFDRQGRLTGHAAVLRQALADMQSRELLCRKPAARLAVVYSPYALGPPNWRRPLFGYMNGLFYYGPGMLFFALRQGTDYGQVDFLAPEDLPTASLESYRAIILPTVIDFPEEAQEALVRYVFDGGIALADLGLGTMQAKGNYQALPAQMSALFGVQLYTGLRSVKLNLEVYRPNPRFPDLQPGLRTNGLSQGYMVAFAAKARPVVPTTDLLFATVASNEFQRPVARPREPLNPSDARYGVFAIERGKGYALFATMPLYQLWMPGNMLFEEFHHNLFGFGADVMLQRPMGLLPTFGEMSTFADGSVMMWGKDATTPVVQLTAPLHQVYAVDDGICDLGPEQTLLRTRNPGVHVARPLPIYLPATPFTISVAILQQNKQALTFALDTEDGESGSPLTVQVGSGTYRITANSQHTLTIITPSGSTAQTVKADAHGWLTIILPSIRSRVLLTGTEPQIDIQHPNQRQPVELTPDDIEIETAPNTPSGDPTQE
ncbi:MAG: beta-galactosidase [Armatimonadota bacterium]